MVVDHYVDRKKNDVELINRFKSAVKVLIKNRQMTSPYIAYDILILSADFNLVCTN